MVADETDLSRVGSPLDSESVIVKDLVVGLDSLGKYSLVESERSWASSGLGWIVLEVLLGRVSPSMIYSVNSTCKR